MLWEDSEHLDLPRVVVGGAGLPLEQVVVLDDTLVSPGREGGEGEGAGAGPVGAADLVTRVEVRGHNRHDGTTLEFENWNKKQNCITSKPLLCEDPP